MNLSRGVLGLKFMRKTLDQIEQKEQEDRHRKFFQPGDVKIKTETVDTVPKTIIRECPSYLQCVGYNYARQSFGGMNPTVEENVRKGIWKVDLEVPDPDKVIPTFKEEEERIAELPFEEGGNILKFKRPRDSSDEDEEEEEGEVKEEDGSDDNNPDKDPIVGSLIGTAGKYFQRKHNNNNRQQNHNWKNNKRGHDPQDDLDSASMAPNKKRRKHFWNKR